jgi:hypothetical protein
MKKTAVEWLEHMLLIILNEEEFKKITFAIEQTKKLEKKQIIDAYNNGQQIPPFEYAEQYYKETFNK